MSYVIDVYRDDAPVSKNFINFGTYVALFPQLIAGPIVRYRDVAEQLVNRRETLEMFTKGVKLFMVGLAKGNYRKHYGNAHNKHFCNNR